MIETKRNCQVEIKLDITTCHAKWQSKRHKNEKY